MVAPESIVAAEVRQLVKTVFDTQNELSGPHLTVWFTMSRPERLKLQAACEAAVHKCLKEEGLVNE